MATKTRQLADFLQEGGVQDIAVQQNPHIQPGTLQPAVAGKLLDGTTNHSGVYGTAQSDGHSYYYTDIKGSKPIKDPRIGAHFGGQRYRISSMEKLEQESAANNTDVYSCDGREWVRGVRVLGASAMLFYNDGNGQRFQLGNGASHQMYLEITGYFSDANLIGENYASSQPITTQIDGASAVTKNPFSGSIADPKRSRFLNPQTCANLALGATLGIHTLRINSNSQENQCSGFELIAQDTSSTANKSKIQIPAQNVVSYGKKFSLSATAHHYNPFATKGDGSASTIPNNTTGDSVATGWAGSTSAYWESTLDTATSLGLGAWESGGNFYRPVNGGRVVKWVDSTGTIKTSVNMMPPEAHSIPRGNTIATGTSAATGTHNWSTQYQPQFGHKTVGSNLITSWANTANAVETLTSTGANITQFTNTSGWGTATTNDLGLTVGRLYKIQISNYDHTSGVGLRIHSSSNGTSADGNMLLTNLPNDTTSSHTFRAGTSDTKLSLAVQSESAAAVNTINLTLYEVEEPTLQAEVAKSFYVREFGNGAANGGADAQYADASMINGADDIAYVMDDGLTGYAGAEATGSAQHVNSNAWTTDHYFTFIGTGFSYSPDRNNYLPRNVVQNLPYGTHVFWAKGNGGTSNDFTQYIDGVSLSNTSANADIYSYEEISIYQPKMPPIPEDACIISDYMLYADWVAIGDAETGMISKGARRIHGSRDVSVTRDSGSAAATLAVNTGNANGNANFGFRLSAGSSSPCSIDLPVFSNKFAVYGENPAGGSQAMSFGGTASTITKLDNSVNDDLDAFVGPTSAKDLGVNKLEYTLAGGYHFAGYDVHGVTHTSSHYQPFETPYLYELVGGDRNMEQYNLVVTADGKSWDEVTRDTSHIGTSCLITTTDTAETVGAPAGIVEFDEWRGKAQHKMYHNKDFAIRWGGIICLKDGWYTSHCQNINHSSYSATSALTLTVNGGTVAYAHSTTGANYTSFGHTHTFYAKRGDLVQITGIWNPSKDYGWWQITKAEK